MYYRNILEPYRGMKSRHRCPDCGQKTFARYINTETGDYLGDNVGRCNREQHCGYHFTPKQFFETNGGYEDYKTLNGYFSKRTPVDGAKKASFVPIEIFKASLQEYEHNSFHSALMGLYGEFDANRAFQIYQIGTSKRWDGATVFWQIDTNGRVRTGKIMLYNSETGKRIKDNTGKSLIDWAHRIVCHKPFELEQCFFGEHRLRAENDTRPVAIVESEKTAVIASIHLPEFIWLACGAKTGLNDSKCSVLKARKVILYPDLGCYNDWAIKAKKYGFAISDILEHHANEDQRSKGFDLADFLIQDYMQSDGKIDLNTHWLIYNKIINTWDRIEKAATNGDDQQAKNLTAQLRNISRKGLVGHLGQLHGPKTFNQVQQKLI